MTLTPEHFLAIADHTLLAPGTTPEELAEFMARAAELGVARVCVSPSLLPVEKCGLEIVTVVGFPSGAHHAAVKATEARQAIADGADEVDMVVNAALVRAADWPALEAEIRAVREAVPAPHVLKVILETAALTPDQIRESSKAAAAAGADFVKTSTGFSPAGGATLEAVRIMAETVGAAGGGALGVKASGGIRTAADARAMWEAGATRFGVSATEAIVAGWNAGDAPKTDTTAEQAGY
ncbi:deoxyribose-phosphate aldolase [Leucobacter sp. cx-42]|uniref:deoxyribose-phosphate aldolase n=1 Tax=unclassified Leucobacter TaxID=2621730 RepID=UPI00165D431D|nr:MULTISPECIES: deoxyribose-phosphate aldolase [unclassified Leucobacter]MBC9953040.1 deoxyribose-phosphate aldolase [Leucobacter sp. cx-42]